MENERPPTSSLPSTFQNSEFTHSRQDEDPLMLSNRSVNSVSSMRQATEMKILAVDPDVGARPERKKDYKGRIRTWPGILLLIAIVGAAGTLITMGAMKAKAKSEERAIVYEERITGSRRIQDGLNSTGDLIDADGQVGNPKKYPEMGCELPDYQSKNGQIFAVSKNGTEVAVGIKGVNWFGMETGLAIPFGLWENQNNGTTAYEVAAFLARNKFNSVRLPLCIKNILRDTKADPRLINMNTNRAMNITSYMGLIKSVVEVLAYRHVTVMISLHTLDTYKSGGAWYSDELDVTEAQFLQAVDILTSNLCSSNHWNILGLDLKNEPHECNWGAGGALDWRKGSKLIAERMLKGCPNWMAFVEGINGQHPIDTTNRAGSYFDWWGGGLQGVRTKPLELSQSNKIVWAPHFYNTGVAPAWYLYADDVGATYEELDDETLKMNVYAVFEDMFGYLAKEQKYAVVLGEFAGLYATDKHPKKTTMRTTDYTIQASLDMGVAGGYMWSLNPESAYQFNPANEKGHYTEGLLLDDWLTPNKGFMKGMEPLNQIRDLKMFPCFPIVKE